MVIPWLIKALALVCLIFKLNFRYISQAQLTWNRSYLKDKNCTNKYNKFKMFDSNFGQNLLQQLFSLTYFYGKIFLRISRFLNSISTFPKNCYFISRTLREKILRLEPVLEKLGNQSKLEFEKYSDSRQKVLQYIEIFKLVPSSVESNVTPAQKPPEQKTSLFLYCIELVDEQEQRFLSISYWKDYKLHIK